MRTIPIAQARNMLANLPEQLAGDTDDCATVITRRGKPVLAVMSYEFFDSLIETLDIMSDHELMDSLKKGINDIKEGKTTPWEKVKAEIRM